MRHADTSKVQQAAHSGGNEHVPTTDGFDELMPKTWPPRPSTGSCTTPTLCQKAVTASDYPRRWPARGWKPWP